MWFLQFPMTPSLATGLTDKRQLVDLDKKLPVTSNDEIEFSEYF